MGLYDFAGDVLADDRTTWYTKAYPDGYEPTLLFVVRSASRQESIKRAIADWRRNKPYLLRAEALTVELAAAKFLKLLGDGAGLTPPGRPRPPRTLTSGEFSLLDNFMIQSHVIMKDARADARTRGLEAPEYPAGLDEVRELLKRLRERG
jgi:hypothetical protein